VKRRLFNLLAGLPLLLSIAVALLWIGTRHHDAYFAYERPPAEAGGRMDGR
jgi:hypothetical protein